MSETLHDAVAHLRNLSSHLNDVTDQATAAVRRVETFLNQECRLGLSVFVPVADPAPGAAALQLGYARTAGRYRIVVRTLCLDASDDDPDAVDGDDMVAWTECPREIKLDAFQQLPDLLGVLQQHLTQVIARTDQAVAAARNITEVLGDAPDGCDHEGEGDQPCRGRDRDRDRDRHDDCRHGQRHHGHHHGRDDRDRDEPGTREHGRHGGGRFPEPRRPG